MRLFGRGNSPSIDAPSDLLPSSPSLGASSTAAATDFSTGPARPIRLVYCDEKGKFQMDPEAVATLQLVKGPVGVVSVCGRARQGKSFILNQVVYSRVFMDGNFITYMFLRIVWGFKILWCLQDFQGKVCMHIIYGFILIIGCQNLFKILFLLAANQFTVHIWNIFE